MAYEKLPDLDSSFNLKINRIMIYFFDSSKRRVTMLNFDAHCGAREILCPYIEEDRLHLLSRQI